MYRGNAGWYSRSVVAKIRRWIRQDCSRGAKGVNGYRGLSGVVDLVGACDRERVDMYRESETDGCKETVGPRIAWRGMMATGR